MMFAASRSALLFRAPEFYLNSAHYPGANVLFDVFLLHHKCDLLETAVISAGSHLLLPLHFWALHIIYVLPKQLSKDSSQTGVTRCLLVSLKEIVHPKNLPSCCPKLICCSVSLVSLINYCSFC